MLKINNNKSIIIIVNKRHLSKENVILNLYLSDLFFAFIFLFCPFNCSFCLEYSSICFFKLSINLFFSFI